MTSADYGEEAEFKYSVVATAHHDGWRCVHLRSGRERSLTGGRPLLKNDAFGFRDLLFIHPTAARIFAATDKTNTDRWTASQRQWLQDLKAVAHERLPWNWFDLDDVVRNPTQLSFPLGAGGRLSQ